MRGDGFGAGRHGRGAGRFNRGAGRGFDSNVWKRKSETRASSSTRASGSDASGFDKWDAVAGGEKEDRGHQEPWKEGGEGRSSPHHDGKATADRQAAPPHQEKWGGGGSDAGGRNNAPVRDRDLPAKPVLVKNTVTEETAVPVARDDASKQNLTPKRKREHHDNEKDDSYYESSGANRFGQSYRGGGKNCRLHSPEKEVSVSEESEEDDELLIESMQLDHEEYLNDSSKWIVHVPLDRGNNTPETQNDLKDVQVTFSSVVRKSLSYADVVTNNWQVSELEGEADPNMKISSDYVVLSPETDNNVDVIPTPPIASEAGTRFSKRNTCGMQEKVEDRARRLASKKDLEGNPELRNNSFSVLSDAELISRASNMGVIIPDGSFACIDVLRELEQVREELDIKKKTSQEKQEYDMFITNGLGHSTPVSLEWLDQDETIFENILNIKLKRIKTYFKGWDSDKFGRDKKRKEELRNELAHLEELEEEGPLSPELYNKKVDVDFELHELLSVRWRAIVP
ncbi:hypothetical protein D1007_48304 [Hordeum vulgare]|nr:hypothetical protein D1007_48304 [Hordeum vulgare]